MKQGRSVIWHRWQSGQVRSLPDTPGQAQRGDTTPNQPQAGARKNVPPGKIHDTHCIGDWMGGLDDMEHLALPKFDPRTVQAVASCYAGVLTSP